MDPSAAKRDGDEGRAKAAEAGKAGDERRMDSILEGQLLKFTSILKGGFLPRWFVLDPTSGVLTYYLSQDMRKKKQPRGSVNLPGAHVSPSEEDSQTFSISAAIGEVFKLKAHDAKERQMWVSHLRHVVSSYAPRRSMSSSAASRANTAKPLDSAVVSSVQRSATLHGSQSAVLARGQNITDGAAATSGTTTPGERKSKSRESSPHGPLLGRKRSREAKKFSSTAGSNTPIPTPPLNAEDAGPLRPVNQACNLAGQQEQELRSCLAEQRKVLRKLAGVDIHSDPNILLLKATAQANLNALSRCLALLLEYQQRLKANGLTLDADHLLESDFVMFHTPLDASDSTSNTTSITQRPLVETSGSTTVGSPLAEKQSSASTTSTASAESVSQSRSDTAQAVGHAVEPESTEDVDSDDDDLSDAERLYSEEGSDAALVRQQSVTSLVEKENRGSVMQLCSNLKLGMDLTQVTLPVSLLDGRSLLELFADLFSHSQLFIQVAEGKTPCQRMVSVVRQYICSFHKAFQHQPVRKPYNAQLGEFFRCELEPPSRRASVVRRSEVEESDAIDFVAEQVSHHPPVSAFHMSCPKHGLSLTADINCKSKFLGMSASVDIAGQGCLTVAAHNEDYVFTFPSAYCRSLLTNPWLEFSGRVRITCPQSAYQATITFLAKPSYGDDYNKVVAEIRPQTGSAAVCKISGRWDGVLTTTHDTGETEVMDVTHLATSKKTVQPIKDQSKMESRRLWRRVSVALRDGDYKLASSHKQALEDAQRVAAQRRVAAGTPWSPKYFVKDGDRWKPRLGSIAPQSTPV